MRALREWLVLAHVIAAFVNPTDKSYRHLTADQNRPLTCLRNMIPDEAPCGGRNQQEVKLKGLVAGVASLILAASSSAQAEQTDIQSRRPTPDEVRMVAPALEQYTQHRLHGELWKRPGLAPRDRSIVTVAALIARNLTLPMPYYFNLALDNGVKPCELSEIITHLAFYSGWANAMAAVGAAKDAFAQRGIGRISFRRLRRSSSRSMRRLRRTVQRASVISSERWPRVWCSTQPTFYSATYGCVPTLRRGTGVW